MAYRKLTDNEIAQLCAAGCEAEDWGDVYVDNPALEYVKHVRFSGTVRFGRFERVFEFPGGLKKHSGLFNATLHNVTVGDDCLVENVSNYIANYTIGHDSLLARLPAGERGSGRDGGTFHFRQRCGSLGPE